MTRRIGSLLVLCGSLMAQLGPGGWKTDLSKRSIDLSELRSGGPPKDGIPAIDNPKFEETKQASVWLSPKEPVLAIAVEGQVRAYPLQILIWHELVNDLIGEVPILVSYCPLCNSAIVFDRRIEGRADTFGVSGMLRHSDMVMYDRQTDSLWQQLTGEAMVGTLTGSKLKILPSQVVSLDAFTRSFPHGKVLSRDTGYPRAYGQNPYVGYEFGNRLMMPVPVKRATRIRPLERMVTVEAAGIAKAYPFTMLRSRWVIEDKIKETRYVVLFEEGTVTALDHKEIARSRDVGSAGVFLAILAGRRLSFRRKDGKVIDKETGSVWNVLGLATDGPLAGKRLTPVEHGTHFAFAWLVFRPDTQIAGEPATELDDRDDATARTGTRRQ
jgi:hypothetical protein